MSNLCNGLQSYVSVPCLKSNDEGRCQRCGWMSLACQLKAEQGFKVNSETNQNNQICFKMKACEDIKCEWHTVLQSVGLYSYNLYILQSISNSVDIPSCEFIYEGGNYKELHFHLSI